MSGRGAIERAFLTPVVAALLTLRPGRLAGRYGRRLGRSLPRGLTGRAAILRSVLRALPLILAAILGALPGVWRTILGSLLQVLRAILSPLLEILTAVLSPLLALLTSLLRPFLTLLAAVLSTLLTLLPALLPILRALLPALLTALVAAAGLAFGAAARIGPGAARSVPGKGLRQDQRSIEHGRSIEVERRCGWGQRQQREGGAGKKNPDCRFHGNSSHVGDDSQARRQPIGSAPPAAALPEPAAPLMNAR